MRKKLLIGLAILIVLVAAGLVWLLWPKEAKKSETTNPNPNPPSIATESATKFDNPKKAAHYETNTPAHAAVVAAVPINVVIDFNFDLAKPSSISIKKGGVEYGVGSTTIDANKLALRRNMNPLSPDGVYTVNYNACWPDGSCHDGSFQFQIKTSEADKAVDLRGKPTVNIDMANLSFTPKNFRINKGTKVVWTNSDSEIHYVNTDSHPAHTYYKEQNSKALNKGDTFSLTFATAGIYPYHCSAHEATMTGSIIVE